tara:strand:+ start:126 stop:323 length:198 start_codon:yes stop_codon:yes gene_type:complete
MGKKKKKKGGGFFGKIRKNPEAFAEILRGLGTMYAGSQGMVFDPKTGKYRKHQPNSKPPGATQNV